MDFEQTAISRLREGRFFIPSLPIPTPIAPELTRIISLPEFCRSHSTFTSCSILLKFKLPFSYVNVDVPTFTTILFESDIFMFIFPFPFPFLLFFRLL